MEIAEAPPPREMLRPAVRALSRCDYSCPACPLAAGRPDAGDASRSPAVRLAGSSQFAERAAFAHDAGADRPILSWWGPISPAMKGFFSGFVAAGGREAGLVVRGIDSAGARARGAGAHIPGLSEIEGRLSESLAAGLKTVLVLPEVASDRRGDERKIGWEEAGILQRVAWTAGAEPVNAPAPPCFS